jgi:hypothetical protein
MSAIAAGFQWLKSVLTGDSTLTGLLTGGIYQTAAPIGTTQPFGLFAAQSLQDMNSATALRIYSPNLYLVKAVGPATGNANLIAAEDRIYTLLNRTNAVVSQGTILASYREQPFYYTELINGFLWEHIGGLYRIQIK